MRNLVLEMLRVHILLKPARTVFLVFYGQQNFNFPAWSIIGATNSVSAIGVASVWEKIVRSKISRTLPVAKAVSTYERTMSINSCALDQKLAFLRL